MTFDNWKYHPDNLPDDQDAREQFLKGVAEDFYRDIWALHGRKGFFSGYTEEACENFIEQYVHARRMAVLYSGQTLRELEGPREMRYRPDTEHVYNMLLQKKLFNQQCLWRAGQTDIPEVWMGLHFHYWAKHIRECPFAEPVTDADIAAMQAFLLDDNYEDSTRWWLHDWQDYDELTEKDADGDYPYLPEWYQFYDARMGTSYLLELPDQRGAAEEVYRAEVFKKAREEREAIEAADAAQGIVPLVREPMRSGYVPSSNEMFYAFALKFDDDYFKAIFEYLWREDKRKAAQEEDYDVADYIATLQDAEVPPFISGGVNWREALKRTAQQYKNGIIAEDLLLLHSEYSLLQTLAPRLSIAELGTRYDADPLLAMVRDQILDGREMLGEARDFDF